MVTSRSLQCSMRELAGSRNGIGRTRARVSARQCSMRVFAGGSKGIGRQRAEVQHARVRRRQQGHRAASVQNRGAYLQEMHTVGRKILENMKRMQNGAAPNIWEGHAFQPS